jgi:hypothetical protein
MRPSVLRRSPRTGPLDAAEQRRKRDQFDRIVERMRAVLGEVEVAAPEDGTARFYGEVSHLETGLQVMVFAGSGAVTFAYWEHEDREAFHHKVAQVVQIACQAAPSRTGGHPARTSILRARSRLPAQGIPEIAQVSQPRAGR